MIGTSNEAVSTPADLEAALWAAAQARARVLESLCTEEILEIVAAAAEAWLKPHYAPRQRVLQSLTSRLRMPRPMLEKGLDYCFSALDKRSIATLVVEEAEDPAALDAPQKTADGSYRRLAGPPMVLHTLAGNVPGLGVPPIVCCLLARTMCVVLDSARQPLLTAAFAATLAEYSRDLGAMVVRATWRHDDSTMERFAFSQASRVELSGDDATIAAIAARHSHGDIVGRGTSLSLGLVPRESDTDRWAQGFAEDLAMFEGLGCLSPHLILVEGSFARARRMAHALSLSLQRLEKLWPRSPRSFEAERERRAFIGGAEVSVACDPERLLLRGRDDSWLIHVNPEAPIEPGPGLRCLTVVPVPDRNQIVAALREATVPLAAVGLAMDKDNSAFPALRNALQRAGATLICPPGRMQAPPLYWRQDGRPRLAALLSWRSEEEL